MGRSFSPSLILLSSNNGNQRIKDWRQNIGHQTLNVKKSYPYVMCQVSAMFIPDYVLVELISPLLIWGLIANNESVAEFGLVPPRPQVKFLCRRLAAGGKNTSIGFISLASCLYRNSFHNHRTFIEVYTTIIESLSEFISLSLLYLSFSSS